MKTQLSGCAIVNDKEEILVLWKKRHGHYEFPGGKVLSGETLEEAAVRECREELGVDVSILGYVGFEEFKVDGQTFQSHKYRGKIPNNQKPKVMEPEKFSEVFWLPIKKYQSYSCAPNLKRFCQKYIAGEIKFE